MSTKDRVESKVTSWKTRTAGLCVGHPEVKGIWNPAVLTRYGEHTLSLEAKYDPPGSAWLALIVTVVAVIIAIVLKAPSYYTIGFIGGSGIVVSYVVILLWRKWEIKLSLENASDIVIDQESSRIGFFIPFDHKSRWIVLEFTEDFAEVHDAIHDIMGPKCRTGKISGGDVFFVIVVLIYIFIILFCFFMMKAILS